MKVALVHDWLTALGGGERVLQAIAKLYPAPLYTLFHDKRVTQALQLDHLPVQASYLNRLPFASKLYRYLLPLYPSAVKRLDLSPYSVILSTSHAAVKNVQVKDGQTHICYCHTPMRYAWDLEASYLAPLSFPTRQIAKSVLRRLRAWDRDSSGVTHFIASSYFVKERIERLYGRDSVVIYPPVGVQNFTEEAQKGGFYITVSRLVSQKNIELIVEAFNRRPQLELIIIGGGPERDRLEKLARNNIRFLGFLPDSEVRRYLARAKGFVFASVEDFGISMVEALAAKTPVLALGKGGALEIVTPGCGLLFHEERVDKLVEALDQFEEMEFDGGEVRKRAERFSEERFEREYGEFVESCGLERNSSA